MLNEQPRDPLRAREPIGFASPMMIFTPQGLMLGAGTILVSAEGARKLKNLKGSEQQVLALLSAAYGVAVAPTVLGNIERAAKCWAEGDDFTAHIHLAHTGLRALDDLPNAAHRLRMAKGMLDHGGSPRSVFEALRVDPRYIDALEKHYNPKQPRVPAGHPGGGQWTRGNWSGAANAPGRVSSDATPDDPGKAGTQDAATEPPKPGIGHNQGPPLEPAPEVPKVGPAFNTSPFWDFTKASVRWLARAGWRPLLRFGIRVGIEGTVGGPVGDFLLAAEAAYWAYKAYPYIKSYFDPPKTLEELRKNEKPGYDDHHIVERWSKNDGIPESKIESPDNIVPIPKLKHWEINKWLDTPNEEFKDDNGVALTPRQFLKGKSWEERYNFGLKVLRDFGVLKS